MDLYEKIVSGEEKLSLVGLGYVGMPIAVAFARKIKVVGFDLNARSDALMTQKLIWAGIMGREKRSICCQRSRFRPLSST